VQDGDEDCGEKKAHRGRIDWSPGKCFALPQTIRSKKKELKKRFDGLSQLLFFFWFCFFSHMQFLFGI